jgi:hypothetical protein
MELTFLFRRHARYRALIDACADAELAPAGMARMEGHLVGCAECRAALEAARVIRASVAALPEVAVPRSFRLTPAMVAAQRPGVARAATPGFLVVARVAAAASVAVFAVVATLNFSGTDDSGDNPFAASGSAAPEAAELKSTANDAFDDDDGGTTAQDTASPPGAASPPGGGGVSGAGVETPVAPVTGAEPTPERNIAAGTDGTGAAPGEEPPADPFSLQYGTTPEDGNGATPWLVGLGALSLAALGTLAFMEFKRRRP